MDPLALLLIASGNAGLLAVGFWYLKTLQSKDSTSLLDIDKHERALKRQVLELQVLRSLGDRVGYSLDLNKILEVITDSLTGLVEFSTVSYMILGSEGRIVLKTKIEDGISERFVADVKTRMLSAFSAMTNQNLHPNLVDETISGRAVDDLNTASVNSFFNLPIVIGNQVVALINVSSPKQGLYGDEDTTILYTILNQVSNQASKLTQVLENEKRRLSAMISSFVDGVVMIDPNLQVIVTNPAVNQLLDLHPQPTPLNPSGINLIDIFTSVGNKANLRGAIQQALSAQTLVKIEVFELGDKAIQVDVEPVKDRMGYLLGAALILHDVTAQKQLERLRDEFTAMMVHELRTPLTTITYSTDMMISDMSKLDPEQLGQNLEIIKSTSGTMLSLVNDLLDVAKIESGKFQIVKVSTDVKQMIAEIIATFKPLADQKQLLLQSQFDQDLPQVELDKKRIGQVLNNLLSNSLKYTPQGSITISATRRDGHVLVSVTDTGEGIDPSDLPRLFSKFEQLGKGRTGEVKGTGLGLVITKGIVEAHGGQIWAASGGVGKGATFTFSIPITAGQTASVS